MKTHQNTFLLASITTPDNISLRAYDPDDTMYASTFFLDSWALHRMSLLMNPGSEIVRTQDTYLMDADGQILSYPVEKRLRNERIWLVMIDTFNPVQCFASLCADDVVLNGAEIEKSTG